MLLNRSFGILFIIFLNNKPAMENDYVVVEFFIEKIKQHPTVWDVCCEEAKAERRNNRRGRMFAKTH